MILSFSDHLLGAIKRPLNMEIFTKDYETTVESLNETAEFDVFGLKINSPGSVYIPHDNSSTRFVMARFQTLGLDSPGDKFLEIGCGAGAIALLAAKYGWDVTATDINPVAVQAAKDNAKANGLHIRALESDLFASLGDEQFDVILFNEPFFHLNREVEEREIALSATGGSLHQRFMRDAAKHIAPGGKLVFSYSNCSDVSVLNQPGWKLTLHSFDYDAGSNYVRALFSGTPNQ